MKRITIIIVYFGPFPEWIALFFETVRKNPSITFLFYTDSNTDQYDIPNIIFKHTTFIEYITNASHILGVEIPPKHTYKICDLKACFGKIHEKEIANSDFYGFADLDLLFGDIRSFYTTSLLQKYDVLSTHEHLLSGHLCLFKNTKLHREMYTNIGGWEEKMRSPDYVGVDEIYLLNAYNNYIEQKKKSKKRLYDSILGITIPKLYLKEQYTTPFTTIPWIDGTINSNQPDTWYYKNGVITNNRDGDRNFMYLHFMNFKSSKYQQDGTKAPWEGKDRICHAIPTDMNKGICIDSKGIFKI